MNSIKEKHFINDISKYFEFNEESLKLKLVKEIEYDDYNFALTYYIDENHELNLETIEQLCQKEFPFIQNPSSKILEQIFLRNRIAKELILNSIEKRNSESIKFHKNDEEHKRAINLAKSVVHDLNKFIYKHKITHSVTNLLLASIESNLNFYGKVDLVLKSEKDWFLCFFKFSKSPFEAKYKYEAILQKKLIENNSNIKISKVFVFNPLNDIIIREYNL